MLFPCYLCQSALNDGLRRLSCDFGLSIFFQNCTDTLKVERTSLESSQQFLNLRRTFRFWRRNCSGVLWRSQPIHFVTFLQVALGQWHGILQRCFDDIAKKTWLILCTFPWTIYLANGAMVPWLVVLLKLSCSEVSKIRGTQDRNSKRQMCASDTAGCNPIPVQFRWVAKELIAFWGRLEPMCKVDVLVWAAASWTPLDLRHRDPPLYSGVLIVVAWTLLPFWVLVFWSGHLWHSIRRSDPQHLDSTIVLFHLGSDQNPWRQQQLLERCYGRIYKRIGLYRGLYNR